MPFDLKQFARVLTACALITFFFLPTEGIAQSHVVNPADLQKEIVKSTEVRQHNIQTVQQFLSSPMAEKAMKSAKVDPVQVKNAVSSLSDEDLAQMASRADKAQADFAAGRLSDRDLIWIIVAVVALILIIVAVR
ncbi:MAG: hypothetical protein DMG65_18665 [Candidatus Angelobacter sp. Gp1-AA117]|nr:MAG: hypothetical protein DMG65_18665 [Candidatus Angelobacter sp. Gp1-AA117]